MSLFRLFSGRLRAKIHPLAAAGLFVCAFAVLPSALLECRAGEASGLASTMSTAPAEPELEDRLIVLINHDRAQNGLPPLSADSSLAAVARDHSRGMVAQGILSHDMAPTGGLEERLNRAGYPPRIARENLARAGTIEQAQTALKKSPGHLENLLASDITHIGVGIARGASPWGSDLYITQIFARPVTPLRLAEVRNSHLARVEQVRRQAGSQPLRVDPVLDQIATSLADRIELPVKRDSLACLLEVAAREFRQKGAQDLAGMAVDVQLLRGTEDLRIPAHLRQDRALLLGTATRAVRTSQGLPEVMMVSLIGLR